MDDESDSEFIKISKKDLNDLVSIGAKVFLVAR